MSMIKQLGEGVSGEELACFLGFDRRRARHTREGGATDAIRKHVCCATKEVRMVSRSAIRSVSRRSRVRVAERTRARENRLSCLVWYLSRRLSLDLERLCVCFATLSRVQACVCVRRCVHHCL